jgi:UDP:flavonoid glycosyltransferase YjiC (YdhE family)
MPLPSHFSRLRPIIAGLRAAGAHLDVWTDASLRDDVERAGGRFSDLFASCPIDGLDRPGVIARFNYVTFAGRYAAQILDEMRNIRPALVLYDSFAVIGHVVGSALDVPFVSVRAGHNVHGDCFREEMRARSLAGVSENCQRAVHVLRDRHGIRDASPYMAIDATSPFLNLCCEPPNFLDEAARRAFEPVACIGSIVREDWTAPDAAPVFAPAAADAQRVYVSFGTRIWRSFPDRALAAMRALASALATRPRTQALFSLGGHPLTEAAQATLGRPNVQVVQWVRQQQALREADVFITHHGLNSTHEAIYCGTPMISYPFHWDQPGQAQTCRDLGVAIPLVDGPPRTAVTPADVDAALDAVARDRAQMARCLIVARGYEEEAIAARPAVFRRVLALADSARSRRERADEGGAAARLNLPRGGPSGR